MVRRVGWRVSNHGGGESGIRDVALPSSAAESHEAIGTEGNPRSTSRFAQLGERCPIMEVIQLSDYRKPPPPRKKCKSQYDLYPMPFFNKKRRCTWDVKPSGDYGLDFKTGQSFAIEFLRTSNHSCGWA